MRGPPQTLQPKWPTPICKTHTPGPHPHANASCATSISLPRHYNYSFMFGFIFFATDRHFRTVTSSDGRLPWILKGLHLPEGAFGKSTCKLFQRRFFWNPQNTHFLRGFPGLLYAVRGAPSCGPMRPPNSGHQIENLDQFFSKLLYVPTFFHFLRVSVPKKLNPNIKRSDVEAKRSQKKAGKAIFKCRYGPSI